MSDDLVKRAEQSRRKPELWECVCAFAKSVDETDPYKFPRVGLVTNVLYRSKLLIQHEGSGVVAVQPETLDCCPSYFRKGGE